MTAILGRTGNLVGFTTGRGTTPWNTEMEAALRKMDAMLASTVVAITNTLPGSANEGDLYLVGTSPTGVAAGWANRIARWRSSPAGWEAYQPMQGWIITIVGESTNKVRRYDGTAWVALAADTDHTHAYIPTAQKGATNGVAELGADGKVPSAQLPTSTLPTDPVFDTVTTTGAAYIGTNLDVTGNAVIDGWVDVAGELNAGSIRADDLADAIGETKQLLMSDQNGYMVRSGIFLSSSASTSDMNFRKRYLILGPLTPADFGHNSDGGGIFASDEVEYFPGKMGVGIGTENLGTIGRFRFTQLVAAGKTGSLPQIKAEWVGETVGSGGSVGGYGGRLILRIRADNANDLSDVLALEAGLATSKAPFRTDSACYSKAAIRTATTTTAANNHVVIFDGMGDRTETLPPATGSNRVLVYKNRSGAFTWTLDGNGSETIDGAATLVLTANQCVTLIDYTTGQWAVIGKVA